MIIDIERKCRVKVRSRLTLLKGKRRQNQCFRCAPEDTVMHLSSKRHHIEESGIFVTGLLLFPLPGTEGSWRL